MASPCGPAEEWGIHLPDGSEGPRSKYKHNHYTRVPASLHLVCFPTFLLPSSLSAPLPLFLSSFLPSFPTLFAYRVFYFQLN